MRFGFVPNALRIIQVFGFAFRNSYKISRRYRRTGSKRRFAFHGRINIEEIFFSA